MHYKILAASGCAFLAIAAACGMTSFTAMKTQAVVASPSVDLPKPSLAGYVSLERIVMFEDVKPLSPSLKYAVGLLRSGNYQGAMKAFQAIQRNIPTEALAYRGENEAARSLGTLDATISRHRQMLSVVEAQKLPQSSISLSVLHYALGDALVMKNYQTPLGENPHGFAPDTKQNLLDAIHFNPRFLEARLALAAYYEYRSQMQGTAARREYETCLRLRPDLYQIRFLHAASWDRPGLLGNEAELRARGFVISDNEKSFPQRAATECLTLVRDHPSYAPPYYQLGSIYADPRYPLLDRIKARHYLAIYAKIGDPSSNWGQYATAELQTLDREMAGASH